MLHTGFQTKPRTKLTDALTSHKTCPGLFHRLIWVLYSTPALLKRRCCLCSNPSPVLCGWRCSWKSRLLAKVGVLTVLCPPSGSRHYEANPFLFEHPWHLHFCFSHIMTPSLSTLTSLRNLRDGCAVKSMYWPGRKPLKSERNWPPISSQGAALPGGVAFLE